MALLRKIEKNKELWGFYLKRNMLPDLLDLYGKKIVFKGTFLKKSTDDKYDVSKYFKKFLRETDSVTFLKNNNVMISNNLAIDIGRYNFKRSDGEIIKAQYVLIFDENGKIITHYSNLYH